MRPWGEVAVTYRSPIPAALNAVAGSAPNASSNRAPSWKPPVNMAALRLSPLPSGTRVREVWVSPGGVAYVDFPADFPDTLRSGSLAEIHAVYGVVATLTSSFPNIRSVQFLVNGHPALRVAATVVEPRAPFGLTAGITRVDGFRPTDDRYRVRVRLVPPE